MIRSRSIVIPLLALAGLLVTACGSSISQAPQPLDQLRWPSALALGPKGHVLYVVGTDFDLAYGSGALQAIDLKALDAAVDASPTGSVARITKVPFVGGVDIAPLGGLVAVAPRTGGGVRVFVPIRGGGILPSSRVRQGGVVTVLDGTQDGQLHCWSAFGAKGLTDCRGQEVPLVAPGGDLVTDPYSAVVTPGGDVIVGAIHSQPIDPNTPTGTHAIYGARLTVASPGSVQVYSFGLGIQDMVVGPMAKAVFAMGTAQLGTFTTADVRSFDPDGLALDTSPPEISVRAVTGSSAGASLRFSTDGKRLYALAGSPNALAVYSVDGSTAKDLKPLGLVSLQGAPSRMAVIPGPSGDLVAITSAIGRSLTLVDPTQARVLAVLDGTSCPKPSAVCPVGSRGDTGRVARYDVGQQPFGLVAEPLGTGGARIWVSSAQDSRLTAVDIPNLAHVDAAEVRAVVTTPGAP